MSWECYVSSWGICSSCHSMSCWHQPGQSFRGPQLCSSPFIPAFTLTGLPRFLMSVPRLWIKRTMPRSFILCAESPTPSKFSVLASGRSTLLNVSWFPVLSYKGFSCSSYKKSLSHPTLSHLPQWVNSKDGSIPSISLATRERSTFL